jgi:CheY-like chemotaxis protein
MPRKSLSILLVETDAALLADLQRFLELDGHAVARVGDADAAAQAIKEEPFDLLIIDVLFPGQRTLEALIERNKQEGPDRSRIVALSRHDKFLPEYYLSLIHKIGVRAILQKPFDRPRLAAAIAEAVSD